MTPIDGDQGQIRLAFAKETTDLDAVQRAAYALAEIMSVDVRLDSADYLCTVLPRGSTVSEEELAHRFRREVIDQTLRLRIGRETKQIRDLIFAVAFSRTGLIRDESEPE